MKKFNLAAVAATSLLLFGAQDVNAISPSDIGYQGSNVTSVEVQTNVYELKLVGDAVQDLVVASGEEVTLDLNGYTLTNYTDATETIKVLPGGKLTIKDSSTGKTGKITQKATSTYGVITNQGVMVIDGGNYETALNFYVVRNEADLTINGGTFTKNSTETAMIGNIGTEDASATLTVTGGEFLSANNVIINYEYNDVTINGGTLVSEYFYALDTWGTANVNGGSLKSNRNDVIRFGTDASTDAAVSLGLGVGATYTPASGKGVLYIDDATNVGIVENVAFDEGVLTDEEVAALLGDEYQTVVDDSGVVTIEKKPETPPATDGGNEDEDEQYVPVTPPAETNPDANETVPETGDDVAISLLLATVSTIGVAGSALYIKKEKLD